MAEGVEKTRGCVISLAVESTSNGKTVFAGTAGGCVWKTIDSGTTWAQLTDTQPWLAIGALAIDLVARGLPPHLDGRDYISALGGFGYKFECPDRRPPHI